MKSSALATSFTVAALLGGALYAAPALAENHALIMWIGEYAEPRHNLPGIDRDAQRARAIAQAMGVPNQNIREVANRQFTRQNVATELGSLAQRVKSGDKVFIYYSGHGLQVEGVGGAKCTEALVTHENGGYFADYELQNALSQLGAKASQVVMMNDSCFSGGAATKAYESRSSDDSKPKFLPPGSRPASAITDGHRCGDAVNKMARNLEVVGAGERGPRVLYIAASSDNEVSFATGAGSVATIAWAGCLARASDTDRSGSITGRELQQCAQAAVNGTRYRQTITIQGNPDLPLFFASSGSGGGNNAVNAAAALRDIQNRASREYQVTLAPAQSTLRVRQDYLGFSVSTNKPGYLYLLQVGSDGKTFNMLFPNKIDTSNYVTAGNHQFPRPSWRVRAAGPVGTSHIIAVITPTQRNVSKDMDLSATFASQLATEASLKTLIVEASGEGGGGAYGASSVEAIREVN